MTTSLTNMLLQELCAERSDAISFELGADASVHVPKSVGVIAYFVLDGEISIDGDLIETPLTIRRGEFALLLYGNAHSIRVSGEGSISDHHLVEKWPIGEEPQILRLGRRFPEARFIGAALRMITSPVSVQCIRPLPELLHLGRHQPTLGSRRALFFDVQEVDSACVGPGGNAFVNFLMNIHLCQVLRYCQDQMRSAMPCIKPTDVYLSPTFRPIAMAVRMLRLHPERHWTVTELAEKIGLSRSSLSAHFKTSVGVSPMEYLTSVRMEKAAELLRDRYDMTLCTIGRMVGYDNTNSFIRAFKMRFGVPPKTFSHSKRPRNDLVGSTVANLEVFL